jgi:hypothetical protein
VARTADRTLTAVFDRDDDVDVLARLRRLHARPFGQVVCEPAPAGGSAGLARSVLAALGKDLEVGPRRDPVWRLVEVHLRAERVRELIVLRAHALSYPALRRLADLADATDVHLWLVVHHERPPAAVAQLLEALPHDTASLERLLERAPDLPDSPGEEDLPLGAGPEFPYLGSIVPALGHERPRRPRTAIANALPRKERSLVHAVWDRAHAWIARWIDEHPKATYQQSADAVYLLARHGDTASEIYVRTRAALDAFVRAGVDTDVDGVDSTFDHTFGEIRPCEFNAAIARAGALADQTPDPQFAALIALAAVSRNPLVIRHAHLRALSPEGSALAGPWGGVLAIPPELRRFLATHHHQQQQQPLATDQPVPLFPGSSHGRLSQPAIRRALEALDAPASLWEDPEDTPIGQGASADGRALLHNLSAWDLWLERRQQRATRPNRGA